MAVTLNCKHLSGFVSAEELKAIAPEIAAAHKTLHDKSGLGNDKLGTLLEMKYHSLTDAVMNLGLKPDEMRSFYLGMQRQLYNSPAVINFKIENNNIFQ